MQASFTECGKAYTTTGKDEDRFFHTVQKFRVKEVEVYQLTE
jgi:hypothetical protein